ncbi:MAG: adenylosuccinate lyase [Cyclobacteriaceae bacterium]|nr:MAG: adenylosuccinate lyase [Cyclobacteriaceae bacterium]
MKLTELTAISPLDGRYRAKTAQLADYFSEYALIKYRLIMEVGYFKALTQLAIPPLDKFPKSGHVKLDSIVENFDLKSARRIKMLEQTTNHDVKAVEYYLKEELRKAGLGRYQEFIHFALTSQDINNTAIPMSLKDAHKEIVFPLFKQLLSTLKKLARRWKNIPMLAHTHGQPASPTRLGKEIEVFVTRLSLQMDGLNKIPFAAKFGGATGNFNAHVVSYPEVDWDKFADRWLKSLGLHRSKPTTQIEHYDYLAGYLDNLKRINTILIDLSQDAWLYISQNYFTQKIKKGEVGSSAMPHKVNPIDFENAEGNFGLSNAMCIHMAAKLPISRLQRDLTDSTILRNLGVAIGYTVLGVTSVLKGSNKLQLNKDALNQDLDDNWAVLGEAIQTILRREGYPKPYEALKELTRNNRKITRDDLWTFIDGLKVKDTVKENLKQLTPFNYTGI